MKDNQYIEDVHTIKISDGAIEISNPFDIKKFDRNKWDLMIHAKNVSINDMFPFQSKNKSYHETYITPIFSRLSCIIDKDIHMIFCNVKSNGNKEE